MSGASRALLLRAAFAVLTAYLALSVTFLLVTLAPNTAVEGKVAGFAFANPDASQSQIESVKRSVLAARNLDQPVYLRYANYMADMTTLRWGGSFSMNAPVTDLVADRLARTGTYAIPGFLLAVVLGVVGGLYSAVREGSVGERTLRVLAYLTFGLPSFYLATVAIVGLSLPPVEGVFGEAYLLRRRIIPALLLALTLFAGQLAYARAESKEVVTAEFVSFLRAKGFGDRGVAYRVLRNAVAPIATLFVTDLLAVLVVAVYVIEFVFDIPGFGTLSYNAAVDRDMPLLLGTTVVVVIVGVVGNFLTDVVAIVSDPRTGDEL